MNADESSMNVSAKPDTVRRISRAVVAMEWTPAGYEAACAMMGPLAGPIVRYDDGTVVVYLLYDDVLDLPITGPTRPSDVEVVMHRNGQSS